MSSTSTLRRPVRALAAAALLVSAAATSAQTVNPIVIGDGTNPPVGASVCPGAGPFQVNEFTISHADSSQVRAFRGWLMPQGAYALVSRVEIRNAAGTTISAIAPTGDFFSMAPPAPLATSPAEQRFTIWVTPKSRAAMPAPRPGYSPSVGAYIESVYSVYPSVSNDKTTQTAIDNEPPPNVAWTSVTPGATSMSLAWAPSANVMVVRTRGGPDGTPPEQGKNYTLADSPLGAGQILAVGALSGYPDSGLTGGVGYFYRVFTRDQCFNWSSGATLGPVFPGGVAEGDVTPNSQNVMVGLLNPLPGVVTAPFRVQVRVFSPGGRAINASSVRVVLNDGVGASQPTTLVRNTKFGSAADSGVFEVPGTVPGLSPAAGRYTLYAEANNGLTTIRSATIGITVIAGAGAAGDGNLLVRDNSSQLCSDCHAIKTHSSEDTTNRKGSWFNGCRACHTPHNTTNAALVRNEIQPPAVNGQWPPAQVYFSTRTGFDPAGGTTNTSTRTAASYANGDRSGPCQVCHTQTSVYTRTSTGSGGHYTTQCTSCHEHTKGFGANCTGCHGTPGFEGVAGADAVVAAAPPRSTTNATLATDRGVGAHRAHVNGTRLRQTPLLCTECHSMPNAHNGSVQVDWGELATTSRTGVRITPDPFDAGGATCSNTYCHGNFPNGVNATVTWNVPGSAPCGSCHSIPPAVSPHYVGMPSCSGCHAAGYSPTTVDGSVHLNGQKDASGCNGCHGDSTSTRTAVAGSTLTDDQVRAMPPTDSLGNSATTFVGVGAHASHSNSATSLSSPIQCSQCHQYPPASGHDTSNPTNVWGNIATGNGTVVPTHTEGAPGCTNYCHGTAALGAQQPTPQWNDVDGTPSYKACNSCHGLPPPVATTQHPSNGSCGSCHLSYTNASVVRATHVDANKDVRTASGCSRCHGDVTRDATPNTSVDAAPGLGVALDSHGNVASATDQPGVGSHRGHLSPRWFNGAIACTQCHPRPAYTTQAHANGTAAWSFDPSLAGSYITGDPLNTAPGYATNQCSNTYCHGRFTGGAVASPTWAAAGRTGVSMTCTSCHGAPPVNAMHTGVVAGDKNCSECHTGYSCVPSNLAACTVSLGSHINVQKNTVALSCSTCHGAARTPDATTKGVVNATNLAGAPPDDLSGSPSSNIVGVHLAHLNPAGASQVALPLACSDCHGTASDSLGVKHADGTRTVTLANSTRANYGSGTAVAWTAGNPGSCTTYCHGDRMTAAEKGSVGTWQWSFGAANAACGSCHKSPPTDAVHTSLTSRGQTSALLCVNCHDTTVDSGGLIVITGTGGSATTLHINGVKNTGTLTCTKCHGDGTSVAPTSTATMANVNDPYDTNGGAHYGHAVAPTIRTGAYTCNLCHPANSESTAYGMLHADASVQVVASTTWATPAATCASIYCHGGTTNTAPIYEAGVATGQTSRAQNYWRAPGWAAPVWTTVNGTFKDCAACHNYPPTLGANMPHPLNIACSTCHPLLGATHLNNRIDVNRTGCGSCHGQPLDNLVRTDVRAAPGYDNSTARDVQGNTAATFAAVGAHRTHLTATALRGAGAAACDDCHTALASDTDTAHATGTSQVGGQGSRATLTFSAFARTGGLTATYTGSLTAGGTNTAGSCGTVYCHGGKWASDANYRGTNYTPSWTGGAAAAACGTCHKVPPSTAGHPSPYPTDKNCGDCHPGYNYTTGGGGTVSSTNHINGQLDGGISSGGQACSGCHNPINLAIASATHAHYVTTTAAPTSPTTYTTATNQARCTQCHVDHDLFNPPAGTKAANLRSSATVANPTASATDHNAGTGVCVSCHGASSFTKKGGGTTPTVNGTTYSASAHDYGTEPSSTFAGTGGGTFNANCSKCHNDTSEKALQSSTNKFALHDSAEPSMLSTLTTGASEEAFCYRCHSTQVSATQDFYGVAAMSATSKDVSTQMAKGTTGGTPTQAATTLYFRNNATANAIDGPKPGAYILASGTYVGTTTFSEYDMALAAGATATTRSNTSGTTTNRWMRFGQFVSPPVAQTVTIPSGSTFTINTRSTDGADTCYERFQIWKRSGTTNTALRSAVYQSAIAMPATATNHSNTFTTDVAVTLNPGDGLILEIEAWKNSGTSATVSESYGLYTTDNASLVLPVSITFQSGAATIASGRHDVGAYSGVHLANETRADIAAAKHVECADCHSPHGAKQPDAQTYGSASGAGSTTTLVDSTKSALWTAGEWIGARVKIRSGARVWLGGTVTGNTTTTLTFTPAIATATAAGDQYVLERVNTSGLVTTAGTGTTITSTTWNNWPTGAFVGYTVNVMTATTGAVTTRTITANTASTLTVNSAVTTVVGDVIAIAKAPDELTGASGVSATTWGASWLGATAFNPSATNVSLPAANAQWQVCFKCHSSANANIASTWSTGMPANATFTDIALEFNPRNQSYHPVVAALPATDPGANGSSRLVAAQLINGWQPGQTMSCTDCHNTDAASPAAQGPHGSAIKYMLAGVNKAWPFTQAAQNGGSTGTLFRVNTADTGLGTNDGLFCRNCHPLMSSTASNSLHRFANTTSHTGTNGFPSCVNCHIRVPHGGKVSRLILTPAAPARYKTGSQLPTMIGFTKNTNKDAYTGTTGWDSNCTTHGGTGGEAW